MYEAEINGRSESIVQIPLEVREQFAKRGKAVVARTILPWGEHCTECAIPSCYSTCELYSPRQDLKCRRFIDGMVRIKHADGLNPYLLKIRFKRWGKLWTVGNVRLFRMEEADIIERWDRWIGVLIRTLPIPNRFKIRLMKKRYDKKKRWAQAPETDGELPDYFLLECYNPQPETVNLTLIVRPEGEGSFLPFQKLIELAPGFNRVEISLSSIAHRVDLCQPFGVDLIPNKVPDDTTLYFGFMDFVKDTAYRERKTGICKCVVWDLDNTLWEGILIEDEPNAIRLKPGVLDVIKELDRRGILLSIASKNNPEDVMGALKRFGLDDYFLYPQISWGPKSKAVAQIARLLNTGIDSLLFVDDEPFERQEVKAGCPDVTVVDASEYRSLPGRPECQVWVSKDSANRRKMYQQEMQRTAISDAFNGDYFSFLIECQIRLYLKPLAEPNLERVHELTQRTNQMNFSGNRYERAQLIEIMQTDHLHTYVMDCADRFGSYGTVGFCVVDSREPRMIDLMFSCRIQSKRVEHAFLAHILHKYITRTGSDFYANYRRTARNAQSGKVFDDMGFEQVSEHDGVASLAFWKDQNIPDDQIIEMIAYKGQRE